MNEFVIENVAPTQFVIENVAPTDHFMTIQDDSSVECVRVGADNTVTIDWPRVEILAKSNQVNAMPVIIARILVAVRDNKIICK